MTVRVCAIVEAGSAPGRNPLLAPLAHCLAERSIELVAWDPTGRLALPVDAPEADLYLVKGDHPNVLTAAGCLADAGALLLNPFGPTAAMADKGQALARAAIAGVRVPATTVAGDRTTLAEELESGPRIVKPVRGAHGQGVRRLGPGEAGSAGTGPWLVQEPVGRGGPDLKVYGVGGRTAVRQVRFVPGVVDLPREPVARPPGGLEDAARAVAAACALTCWGADFLLDDDGLVLVDVNAFPGYRGVPEAPGWIADAVCAALRGTEAA